MLFNKKQDTDSRESPYSTIAPDSPEPAVSSPPLSQPLGQRKQAGPPRSVIDPWLMITGDLQSEGDVQVDGLHISQQHAHVRLAAQNPPDGRGNVTRRQPGRGHLVKERLKHVVVAPVDEGHPHWGPPQRPRRIKPRKTAPNDNHVVRSRRFVHGSDEIISVSSAAAPCGTKN